MEFFGLFLSALGRDGNVEIEEIISEAIARETARIPDICI